MRAYEEKIASGSLATVKGYGLTDDDRLRADIIERIMCDYGVDLDVICTRHGMAADAMLESAPRLQSLISDGVVELRGGSLAVTEHSRFLVRSVLRPSMLISTRRSSCTAAPSNLDKTRWLCRDKDH